MMLSKNWEFNVFIKLVVTLAVPDFFVRQNFNMRNVKLVDPTIEFKDWNGYF